MHKSTLYLTTSTCIRRLFWFGDAEGGIQKMRSKFFEKRKSSAVAGTHPESIRDGGGGKSSILIIQVREQSEKEKKE